MSDPDWAPLSCTFAGVWDVDPHWVEENTHAVTVLDVREPAEWDGPLGRIPSAILIPLGELAERAHELSSAIRDLTERLRHELAVAEEQLLHFADEADDARLRALVSETPISERDFRDAQRHAELMFVAPVSARLLEAEQEGRLGVASSIVGRIRQLGGEATVTSVAGEGTIVELWVPSHG